MNRSILDRYLLGKSLSDNSGFLLLLKLLQYPPFYKACAETKYLEHFKFGIVFYSKTVRYNSKTKSIFFLLHAFTSVCTDLSQLTVKNIIGMVVLSDH